MYISTILVCLSVLALYPNYRWLKWAFQRINNAATFLLFLSTIVGDVAVIGSIVYELLVYQNIELVSPVVVALAPVLVALGITCFPPVWVSIQMYRAKESLIVWVPLMIVWWQASMAYKKLDQWARRLNKPHLAKYEEVEVEEM